VPCAAIIEYLRGEVVGPAHHGLSGLILTDVLPSLVQAREIATLLACPDCFARSTGFVSYEARELVSLLFARCTHCGGPVALFFSTDTSVEGTGLVMVGAPTSREYRRQIAGLVCSCGERLQQSEPDVTLPRRSSAAPFIFRCSHCASARIIGFRETPRYYCAHDVRLARQVRAEVAEASVVFSATAAETFLQKALLLHASLSAPAAEVPNVNFQGVEDANRAYAEAFGISLKDIAGELWQPLSNAFQLREWILHNSAHDNDSNPFEVTVEYADAIDDAIEQFLSAVDLALRKQCVY
jgi:hypothetical protein